MQAEEMLNECCCKAESSMPPEITTGEREGDKWKSGEKFVQFLIAAEIGVRQIET